MTAYLVGTGGKMWRALPLRIALAGGVVVLAALAGAYAIASSGASDAPPVGSAAPATPSSSSAVAKQKVSAAYAKLPFRFEATPGRDGRYVARGAGYGVFVSGGEAALSLAGGKRHDALIRMRLLGSNPSSAGAVHHRLPGHSNYLVGKDKREWRTGVPGYGKVSYSSVYPGTDVVYYGRQGRLEYDFLVKPRADPGAIALGFKGAERLSLDRRGDLVLKTPAGRLRQHRPVIYQRIDGKRRAVQGSYVLRGKNRVGFRLGAYDHRRALVIDPVLSYSTYLGGTNDNNSDGGNDVAVDSSGAAYVTGDTQSEGFPTTAGAYDTTCGGCPTGYQGDAFVTKLSPTGALVYSTYLGGDDNSDSGQGVAVNPTCASSCSAYVAGMTFSTNFPTVGAVQDQKKGYFEGYFATLKPDGSDLEYSTYFGGTGASGYEPDYASAVAVDSDGKAYLSGTTGTPDLPTTTGAYDTTCGTTALNCPQGDGYLAKFDPTKTGDLSLVYSTYLGGSGADYGLGVAVDSAGSAYLTGTTYNSDDFPAGTTAPFQPARAGGADAYVAKLNPAGSVLDYSTYLGGAESDSAADIAVEGTKAYVTGSTSSADFPTTAGAYQTERRGSTDGYVAKIDPSVAGAPSLLYSSYLGPESTSPDDYTSPGGIAVDPSGGAYVTGYTDSNDFPAVDAFQTVLQGSQDAFAVKLKPGGSALDYSSYLGGSETEQGNGIAVPASCAAPCRAHVTGWSESDDYPTKDPVQGDLRGTSDAFVAAIDPGPAPARPAVRAVSPTSGSVLGGTSVTITGVNFTGVTAVSFGGVPAASFSIDPSGKKITAVTPAHGATVADVTVTGPGGTSATSSKTKFLFGLGRWRETGQLGTARTGHTATLLPSGKVLVTGGGLTGVYGGEPMTSSELYDPKTGTWSPTGDLTTPRAHHTATLLKDGKVLIAGGAVPDPTPNAYPPEKLTASAEIYDPAANGGQGAFTALPASMATARSQHTATRLQDGKVLLAGGCTEGSTGGYAVRCGASEDFALAASAEIFDPVTGSFSPAGDPGSGRVGHSATLLPTGKVLFVGGTAKSEQVFPPGVPYYIKITIAPAQLYNPADNSWSSAGTEADPRADHSAQLLPNGKVLIAGGTDGLVYTNYKTSSELYNPQTNSFSNATPQKSSHSSVPPALLPNGQVLIASGAGDGYQYAPPFTMAMSELFDPVGNDGRGVWRPALPTLLGRDPGRYPNHSVTLLSSDPDGFAADPAVCGKNCGKVLVAGGQATDASYNSTMTTKSELYTPSPTITSLSPTGGPAGGGTTVTIRGTGFTHDVSEVRFGGAKAKSFTVNSFSKITAVSPVGAGGTSVPVTVLNDGGKAESADRFKYTGAAGALTTQPSGAPFAGCPALTTNVIRGTAAVDTITGTPKGDRIFAGAGNDLVNALAGNDCVDLGRGADRGRGGAGADLIRGGAGGDRISGGAGRDRVRGGSGRDSIAGGGSRDRLRGDSGNDRISGNSGNDSISGGSGNDRLKGGTGRDRIAGGGGRDRIDARDGRRDRVSCGRGRDTVLVDRVDRVSRGCERIVRRR